MAHFPPSPSRSMRSLAIALFSVSSVSAIASPTSAAVEQSPLGPWRQAQFVEEGSVLDLGLDNNNFLDLAAPDTAFSPPDPLDAPPRREPAGTRFAPPSDLGTPGRREPAGTRGTPCVRLLLPAFRNADAPNLKAYGYGKTISDRPPLYFYLDPVNEDVQLRVFLFEQGTRDPIATVHHSHRGAAGLYEIDLFRDTDLSLEPGKTYTIRAEVACADPIASDWAYLVERGIIQRVEPGDTLTQQLAAASSDLERVNLFAQEGLWIDLMMQVADIARDRPNDPQLKGTWNSILKKLQSDFAGTGENGRLGVTERFFQELQERDLVVIEPDA